MKSYTLRGALLASTIIAGALAAPAFAQTDQAADTADTEDTIVVTGSRLNRANVTASSPVLAVDADVFVRRGTTDVVDLINTLPSVTAGQTSEVSNGATGTSSLNLRGLGSNRTLVLIDGKRLGPGRPDISSADLNQVPTPLLERVEIVTGGASAVYGSDAIGGVANFILKKDFEGVEFRGTAGVYYDRNNSKFAQDVLTQTSTDGVVPKSDQFDGYTYDVSAIMGANSADGRANITGYLRYLDVGKILQGKHDVSRCALGDFGPNIGSDIFCFGSNFGPFPTTFSNSPIVDPNTGLPLDPQPGVQGTISLDENGNIPRDANGNIITGAFNAFNFNPDNFFQRPTHRYQGGFIAHYDMNRHANFYMNMGYTRNVTDAQIAPTATFGTVQAINCDNPFMTAEIRQVICTDRGLSGSDLAPVQINRRNVEGGGRLSRIELTNVRMVGGVKGELGGGWNYDQFIQYANTAQTDTNKNDFNIELLNEALRAVDDGNGNIVCSSRRPGCIPLNLFGTTPVDPVATAAVSTPTILTGSAVQMVFGGTVSGDVKQLTSPFASTAPQVLFGYEWRRDRLQSQPDSILAVGGSTGLGGETTPTDARSKVFEVFTEVSVPLVEDQPFFEELSFNGAYRYSDYSYQNNLPGGDQSDGFTTDTYSSGLAWKPVSDIRFRVQYQRAVRAPNVFELFSPSSKVLFNANDPCSGPNPTGSLEGCVASGLPANLYGLVPPDAGQLRQLVGGNVNLKPEKSNTYTIGAVLQPRFVPGLTLTVDYYNISVKGFINTIPPQATLAGCINDLDPTFCNLFHRDSLGTIQIDGFIEGNLQNVAKRKTSGVDVEGNYHFSPSDMGLISGDIGSFNLNYIATFLHTLKQQSFAGQAFVECKGFFADSCDDIVGQPTFKYRHVASLTWQSPYDVDVTMSWRYYGSATNLDTCPGCHGEKFGSKNFYDLAARWDVSEKIEMNAGINNVFDTDPPITNFFDTSNGNTFPGVYDAVGRYLFLGARVKL